MTEGGRLPAATCCCSTAVQTYGALGAPPNPDLQALVANPVQGGSPLLPEGGALARGLLVWPAAEAEGVVMD